MASDEAAPVSAVDDANGDLVGIRIEIEWHGQDGGIRRTGLTPDGLNVNALGSEWDDRSRDGGVDLEGAAAGGDDLGEAQRL